MNVTARKMGGSVGFVIPKAVAESLGIHEGQSLDLTQEQDAITLRKPSRQRRPMAELVKEIESAAYARNRKAVADGRPVGKEID